MKPTVALGLALVIVAGLVALASPGLRPLAGALAVCALALVVYGLLPRSRKPRRPKGGYSWEEDERAQRPPEIYTAQPGQVEARPRTPGQEPEFTSPTPGVIPPPRAAPSGGQAEYSTAPSDVPEPRERPRSAPEYTAHATELPPDAEPRKDVLSELPPGSLPGNDGDIPPMAPPPPP